MQDDFPFVSVIIPNYNHEQYLAQRIESVLSQTYQNFEVIILDDCSTDASVNVIMRYSDNPRVTKIIINEQNVGSPFKQWQKGISIAHGEWIWIAESDDYCRPTLLEELIKASNLKPGTVLSYSTSIWVNSSGRPIWTPNVSKTENISGKRYLNHYLLFACFLYNASSAIFKKEAALSVSDRYMHLSSAGDYLFWAELASKGRVAIVNKGLNFFRRHCSASSKNGFLSGVNLRNERIIYEYIIAVAHSKPIRKRIARAFRTDYIHRCKFLSDSDKKDLLAIWRKSRIFVLEKIILWAMSHLRMRYNYYL